ncbi:DUF1254 domain-containing protein [Pseudomonas sp. B35(2017)]|uniref:DUF1254 domain-containing protein n=1 Tax=Pseudomonas sp. B35(2017) TaxID=1981722 RepID=UPI000A1F12CE|nr:DUF1254 domain-containing protein [Pseudomonas sp. B35(2017)]
MRKPVSPRALTCMALCLCSLAVSADDSPAVRVDAFNFIRAETDLYFKRTVEKGGFGALIHERQPTAIEKQTVVRMNRDTLYTSGVFDLDAGPVSITLPEAAKRFMSLQVISQDHYTTEVTYTPGRHTYDRDKVGTRYVFIVVRTLVNAGQPDDVKAAQRLQDAIGVEQANKGRYETVAWDAASQTKVRQTLETLSSFGGGPHMFGTREEVNPIAHLMGTAAGWGGNPDYAAKYVSVFPEHNDGRTPYKLTVKNVPVDGFWSLSVYDRNGYFEKNALGAYSLNNLTAKPDRDGAYTIQFGACQATTPNCLPVTAGWNYVVRLYRPRPEVLDGQWKFPEAQPAQ